MDGSRSTLASIRGTEAISASVYGWRGARKRARVGPLSTIRPAYITADRKSVV